MLRYILSKKHFANISMDISSFETELKFSEKTRVITPAQAVVQRIGGEDISKIERPHEPGVRIRDAKLKVGVLWSYDGCSILVEDPPDYKQALSRTMSLFEGINKAAPIGKIELRRLRIYWIRPVTNYDFKSLERKYRRYFTKESKIFEACYDSSVVMCMKIDNFDLHHQSGITGIKQLQEDYRVFEMKEVASKVFIFLETSVSRNDVIKYSMRDVESFLVSAFEICENHSNEFEKIMEELI